MHEMEEMKRAQELRVDDFSVQQLRESHETIQRLSSKMQEMQEQMNSMNDSGGISRSGIESQREIVSRSCLNHRETFLAIHALCSIHQRHFIKEFFTLRLQVRFQYR